MSTNQYYIKHIIGLTLITSSLPILSVANTVEDIWASNKPTIIELSGSLSANTGVDDQTIRLTPAIVNKYNADGTTRYFSNWEVFLAIPKKITDRTLGQFGIALNKTTPLKLKGDIWQDALPVFNNFDYSYKVIQYGIALKNKFLFDIDKIFKPYLNINLGLAFNRAYDFEITPTAPGAIAGSKFTSNTKNAFTYRLGTGIQAPVGNDGFQLAVGYEFADLGKNNLDKTNTQTMNSGIKLDHLYSHSIQFSLALPQRL